MENVSTTTLAAAENTTLNATLAPAEVEERRLSISTIVHLLSLIVFSVAGVVGNLLVMAAVATTPKLHIIANLFVVNLSITDLCVCAFFEPFYMFTLYHEGWPYHPVGCQVIGFFTISTFGVSITTLSTIAVNRYVLITRSTGTYRKVFSRRNNYIWVGWPWIFSFFWTLLPVAGFGTLGYNSAIGYCAYSHGDPLTWWFLCTVLAFAVLPCIVMMFLGYFLTFRAIRASRQRVQQATAQQGIQAHAHDHGNSGGDHPPVAAVTTANAKSGGKWSRTELKVTKQLFFIFTVFCLCWLPYCIANLCDRYAVIPKLVHKVVAALAWFNSSLNPYLYAWMNRNFREAYKKLLCCGRNNKTGAAGVDTRTAGSTGTDNVQSH